MLKRLKLKFVAVIMVIVTAMLCLVFGLVYHFTRTNLERESLDMMRSIAAVPFRPEWTGDPPGRGTAPDREAPASQGSLPFLVVRLDPRGEPIAAGGSYDREFLAALVAACQTHGGQNGVLKEYALRFCRVDSPEGQRLVFADVTNERAALRSLAKSCAVIGAACFAAFLGASLLLARWMVRPVEQAWEQQKQFVADASHELKTPLTVIMTNAELLQGPDRGEAARFADSILTMSRQMRSLVERLLDLARSDSGRSAGTLAAVDLSALAENALLPFEPLFFERGLELLGEIEPGITVQGSAEQLRQAVDALLDNAQKYSAPGGRVEVRLRRAGKRRCRLGVSNPGDPLSKTELEDIFKRFYRVDKARSRDGSFGLGLSIAQGIVERHRGRIWAESENGVNTFCIELPTN